MRHYLKIVLSLAVVAAVAVGPVSGIALGEEEKNLNPWERDQPATSTKQPDKDKVTRKTKQANTQTAKQTDKNSKKQPGKKPGRHALRRDA